MTKKPPANTDTNRRALVWTYNSSLDEEALYRSFAEELCAQWRDCDASFERSWRSIYDPER